MESKGFFQFEIVINVYWNTYVMGLRVGIDFRRQYLASTCVRYFNIKLKIAKVIPIHEKDDNTQLYTIDQFLFYELSQKLLKGIFLIKCMIIFTQTHYILKANMDLEKKQKNSRMR